MAPLFHPRRDRTKLRTVERLDDDEIAAKLDELDGWERDGDAISRTFKLDDFVGSVRFVDKLVEPAEDMGHHPDLSISWDEVRVSITTHSEGGLTANDFELAKRIDALA
jgi:4a-hydroxytetrahydrobiopterin dehydratase